jgi:hypothetical protein
VLRSPHWPFAITSATGSGTATGILHGAEPDLNRDH